MRWKKLKAVLSHAFAYDDGRSELTEDDLALLDRVAKWVVERRLTAPAIMLLESTAPLNFVGSSLMTFFRPIVGLAFNTTQWERFELLLEKRCTMHVLTERIESHQAELDRLMREKSATSRTHDSGPKSDNTLEKRR
ncbi:MAG: hypothetical protein ACUVWX_05845 [Kiritimatiellia bacterium]